ncbi:class I adenylate-forming enzyme family protein [Variovorax terrae]|uniref:Acyl--CoA ligase n=1 Tax=Variovorax terrae TaxID=2923278 RepID=A0A9X2AMI1_9BURK|nr:class I adenylate-forming enzyme family protein [Variovorax terrae]MCJ0763369.1 acyl--CoA ligase [Variovorax terrae]
MSTANPAEMAQDPSQAEAALRALQGLTVPALIERRAREMPFRIALSACSAAGGRDRLSYAQLARAMRRVGAGLTLRQVGHGDRVAVYLGNNAGREAVLTALGCMAIGAVVVPLNTRSAPDELRHALELVRPVAVVTTAESAERLRSVCAVPLMLVDAHAAGAAASMAWPEPTIRSGPAEHRGTVAAQDAACLLFTSGTTSRPKAVVHTHRSMLHAGLAMGSALGLHQDDLYQGAFPFFTSSCLNLACMSTWVHGSGFVMEGELGNADRLRLIESECTTVYHGVPSVLQFMLDEAERGAYDLARVRRVAYGGAAMPASAIERMARQWPGMEQIHVWGMTESGPAGAWLPPQWLPAKAGLMGQAMPYCELQVCDAAGQPVPRGEIGELCFRGPSLAAGYFEDEPATAQAFRDGWLCSGDLVAEDEDGLLLFIDRKKDVINRGGLKISSAAVESVLLRLPGVAEAAVVAVPHPVLGDDVAACLVLAPGAVLDPQQLAAHCAQHLADYAVPRHWISLAALPKNPMGKILKRELREAVLAGTAATTLLATAPQANDKVNPQETT